MENILEHVPKEIIMNEILPKLPSKSLCRFLSVCKSWHTTITSKAFIVSHLNQNLNTLRNTHLLLIVSNDTIWTGNSEEYHFYPYNHSNRRIVGVPYLVLKAPVSSRCPDHDSFESYHVIGTCNGLVCLWGGYSSLSRIVLWNPSIQKFVTLPEYSLSRGSLEGLVQYFFGFGINLLDNDYKVVRIIVTGRNSLLVEVYSLGTNEWRKINDVDANNIPIRGHAYLRGRCHWVGHRVQASSELLITSFDMSDEMFRKVSVPKEIIERARENYYEGESSRVTTISKDEKECLAIMWIVKGRDKRESYHIWMMNEYGVSESWNKLYNIDMGLSRPRFIDCVGLKKNGVIWMELKTSQLTCYDLEDGSRTNLELDLNIYNLSPYMCANKYVESLVLL